MSVETRCWWLHSPLLGTVRGQVRPTRQLCVSERNSDQSTDQVPGDYFSLVQSARLGIAQCGCSGPHGIAAWEPEWTLMPLRLIVPALQWLLLRKVTKATALIRSGPRCLVQPFVSMRHHLVYWGQGGTERPRDLKELARKATISLSNPAVLLSAAAHCFYSWDLGRSSASHQSRHCYVKYWGETVQSIYYNFCF